MASELERHPESEGGEGLRVTAEAARPRPGLLQITYRVLGSAERVRLPPPAASERADELWLHTCFEAFVLAEAGAYYEFNFAPSTGWAAYRLDGYRAGLAPAVLERRPVIQTRADEGVYELEATLNLSGLPDLIDDFALRMGLSAILEDGAGGRSYWAIRHPPGKPDFHHPDSFALELPAPA